MPIVLRLTKGAELTFAELDGNFTDLDGRLDTIEGFDLNQRVTRLEAAGTPIYFDSDDVMVMLDSIWAGGVDSFLATTDSIGLASFDSAHFLVDSGHVSIRLATKDSVGISSFDSEDFVVTNGHVIINPNSPGGRVAGITPIDSTGVASFDSAEFNVSSDGHVTLTDSAVRTKISAIDAGGDGSFVYNEITGIITYTGPSADSVRSHFSAGEGINISATGVISGENASTSNKGIASFSSSDFSVSSGVVSLAGGSGIPVSSGVNVVGSIMFLQTNGMSNGQVYAPGTSVPGSKLGYGTNTNSPTGFSFRKIYGTGNISLDGTVGVGSMNSANYSGSFFQGVSGTWRNLGPGIVGYKSGWFTEGNTGSRGYALFQRIS